MLKKKSCSKTGLTARLGGRFCRLSMIASFLLIDRSVVIDPATFNKEALDELIAQDKVIGAVKWDTAEDANTDPAFTDLPSGDRIKNTRGKKGWNFIFYKNNCFQNQLAKLDSDDSRAILLVTEDGSIVGKETSTGMLKGFDVKTFTGIYNAPVTAEPSGSTLMVDILSSNMKAWQGESVEYESDEIDFSEINPIAEVNIEVPILVAAATTTVLELSNLCSDAPITGLTTPENWKMRRNGTLEAVTAVSGVNGAHTFTHAALVAGDKIQFEINVAGYPVYTLDTSYYVGKSIEKTVA